MSDGVQLLGQRISAQLIDRLCQAIAHDPERSRSALARRLCEWLDWRSPSGRLCEVGGRKALIELERRGHLTLPAPRCSIPSAPRRVEAAPVGTHEAMEASLAELGEVTLVPVTGGPRPLSATWHELVAGYHYLGAGPLVGAQLRYLIRCERGWLGAMAFSAPAWRVACRDAWIGWSDRARRAHLQRVVCQSRFLIAPWVRVDNLATKSLALARQRLPADWEAAYGERPVLVETYVDTQRFRGSCYRADNWTRVGSTQGRGRQDRKHACTQSIKDVYLHALHPDARAVLCDEPVVEEPSRHASMPALDPHRDWADEEFGAIALGDRRLDRRVLDIARAFYARPMAQVPQACGSRARTKAAYRLFDNDAVTLEKILAPHFEATARRVAEHRVVLAVQDTTSFNYTAHAHTEGLGPIGTRTDGPQGILLHDTMAFTPGGLALGLVAAQVWVRDPATHGKSVRSEQRPIEQKESRKWLRSFEAAQRLQDQCPDTTVVSVGDREADLYELLAMARDGTPHLLVRAQYPRKLEPSAGQSAADADVWSQVEAQPVAGIQVLQIPRRKGQKARTTQLEVRFASVELCAPRGRRKLGPVKLWAIEAREIDAPEGVDPVQWRLYTTLEIESFEQAVEKLGWYADRWQIEVYHRTLKSGCRIEDRRLGDEPRLENCLAIDLVVAWRVLHLTKLGRETPDLPCTVYFQDHEWKALYAFVQRTPYAPTETPTIRDAMRTVAGLGGFLGRKGDGEPGAQSLWTGLQRLDDIAWAWQTFGPEARDPPPPVPSGLTCG